MVKTRHQEVRKDHSVRKRSSGQEKKTKSIKATVTASPTTRVTQKRRELASQSPQYVDMLSTVGVLPMLTIRRLGNHILFLFVGPGRELVTLHSELLPETAKFYINGQSGASGLYQLPDEDVDTFNTYRLFLYTGRIYTVHPENIERPDNGRQETHNDAEWVKLAYCYFFGLLVKDDRFTNACISAIVEKVKETERFPSGIASDVYEYTTEGDKLRKLIVDLHVWFGKGSCIKKPHEDADGPKEFLQDVINGLALAGPEIHDEEIEMPWERNVCRYHTHSVWAQCGH